MWTQQNTTETPDLESIYTKYASSVHRRCVSFLKSEDAAWDATQEIFIKLMKSLPKIKKKQSTSLWSWLLQTTNNHCISELRKKDFLSFDESYHTPSLFKNTEDGNHFEQHFIRKNLIQKLLNPWKQKVQNVILLTYIDGYPLADVARITGVGESTVRRYLTQFRRDAQKWKTSQQEEQHV